jgi:glutathione S-transferase
MYGHNRVLDHLDGEPVLTGRGARDRAMVHMMQRRAEAELLDAVATYFRHATPGLGPQIEKYQNREWGENSAERALAGMRPDGVLRERPYLAGERFMVADITAFAGLAFADFAKIDVPEDLMHLKAWRVRVAQRPSVAQA